jgi:hypothetical protein
MYLSRAVQVMDRVDSGWVWLVDEVGADEMVNGTGGDVEMLLFL